MMPQQPKYDLVIAYRIYPKISSNPPPVHQKDKLELSRFCLESLKSSATGLRVKLLVFLNGCPPEYEEIFTARWPAEDLVFFRYPGVSPAVTLRDAAEALMEQTDAEIVQFTDDDYFYLPGQLKLAVDFFRSQPDADFIAPYESSDFYTSDLHNYPFERRESLGKQWISCISTTHTFLARHRVLSENRRFLLTLFRRFPGRGNPPDLGMWMALTKKRIFNPLTLLKWVVPNRFWVGSVAIAWMFGWRQILFGRRYKLWCPHPCIANHMAAGFEAPGVSWHEEFTKLGLLSPQKDLS